MCRCGHCKSNANPAIPLQALARRGIRLRQFGQEISQRITGKKIHTIGIVAGGTMIVLDRGTSKEKRASVWLSPGVGMVSCGGAF